MGYNMLYLQFVDLSSYVYTHLSPTHNNNPTGKVNVHRVCTETGNFTETLQHFTCVKYPISYHNS